MAGEARAAILKGIGKWWAVNGESIRGTTRTPLAVQAWGQSTRKGNKLYLHVFDGRIGGKVRFGPGKKHDDVARNWTTNDSSITWPVRTNEEITFEVHINYEDPDEGVI